MVEVGCGKGSFLRKLVNYPGANNSGYGFDPSYVGPAVELDGRLQFSARYYDEACAGIAADVVVCRHVIEHVPEPLQVLRSVRAALASSSRARVFLKRPVSTGFSVIGCSGTSSTSIARFLLRALWGWLSGVLVLQWSASRTSSAGNISGWKGVWRMLTKRCQPMSKWFRWRLRIHPMSKGCGETGCSASAA
ncbi:methyltransferase domain-containing protein [Azotobacter chroococcum]